MAAARLVDSDGVRVALVRRFDRVRDLVTGAERRLFFVSPATLMTIAPRESGEHAETEIADVIRQRSADSAADLEELWRLSPAFDVNPFHDRAR